MNSGANADADQEGPDLSIQEHANCTALIMVTGILPGGKTNKKLYGYAAYGATTLEARHVKKRADGVHLEFTGAHNVKINVRVDDPPMAKMLTDHVKRLKPTDTVFMNKFTGRKYTRLDASTLNQYIHTLGSGIFTAKDFRTRLGTNTAKDAIAKMKPPKTVAEFREKFKLVGIAVAEKLGQQMKRNESGKKSGGRSALENLIDPRVFSVWKVPGIHVNYGTLIIEITGKEYS